MGSEKCWKHFLLLVTSFTVYVQATTTSSTWQEKTDATDFNGGNTTSMYPFQILLFNTSKLIKQNLDELNHTEEASNEDFNKTFGEGFPESKNSHENQSLRKTGNEDAERIQTLGGANETFTNNLSDITTQEDLYFIYLPFGIISVASNLMIIVIMTTPNNRGKSTSLLFTILAVSDTTLTLNNMFYCMVESNLLSDVDYVSDVITNLIWKLNMHFSNYFLLVITVERVVSVAYPLKVKAVFTKKVVTMITLVLLVVIPTANVPLWCMEYPVQTNLDTVDFVFGFSVPYLLIMAGGIYIIVKLKFRLPSNVRCNNSVTNIVLATNLAFLVSMLPRRVIYLIRTGIRVHDNLLTIGLQFLECLNTGVNFFVYILAGRKFREDFKNLVMRRNKNCPSRSRSSDNANNMSDKKI